MCNIPQEQNGMKLHDPLYAIPYFTWIWESRKLGVLGNFEESHDRLLPENWEFWIFDVNSHSQIHVK